LGYFGRLQEIIQQAGYIFGAGSSGTAGAGKTPGLQLNEQSIVD